MVSVQKQTELTVFEEVLQCLFCYNRPKNMQRGIVFTINKCISSCS